ncbi:MAG TPA: lipase [Porticoccaceae bacterium]|nr:lipase [Porticoccaceae bacterium]|tara:strand:- start:411 stop:1379 length:969 start_codon:yes stop_codon:yes gene_type:complete
MNLDLIDKELLTYLESFPELDIWTDIVKTRARGAQMRAEMTAKLPMVEGVDSVDHQIPQEGSPSVLVRVYRPEDTAEPLPALLWIHGGGYCFGAMENDDQLVRDMAKRVGSVVVSVEYRLAPEDPFPAPLNDCSTALQWLFDNADGLSVDPSRIAVGGVSAGAGLAAALSLSVRDNMTIKPMFQFLLCPMIDDRNVTPSSYSITDERVWNRNSNSIAWRYYLGQKNSGETADSESVSGYMAASRALNLKDLPPAYIAVGSVDAFVDENREYAERLQSADVEVQFEVFEGGFHAFEYTCPKAKLSVDARLTHYTALKRAFFGP